MKFITILTIAYFVIAGDLFTVMANEANEYMRASNICLEKNPELSPFHDLLHKILKLPDDKQHTSKDPMTNKARSMGFDNYDEIARAAAALKNPEKESIYKKRLLLIDLGAVNGAVALYTLTQKLDDVIIFNVSGYYYTAMLPIAIGIKVPPGSTPKRGDPLCLYGVQYRLLEVIKTKTIDGFDAVLPIFEPIKFNIMEAMVEQKKADEERLKVKRQRQSNDLKRRQAEEKRIAGIEKDIANYQKIANSATGKEMMPTVWQSLVSKYPEARDVKMGNVNGLKMVLRIPDSETVMDNKTGLTWQKEDDARARRWDDAMSYCKNLALREMSDWRLPTKRELESIVDSSRRPAIDTVLFPSVKSESYWTSTVSESDDSRAWLVHFDGGSSFTCEKRVEILVRCVR